MHLGIGAFHRAHQAVLTEAAALASGVDEWRIVGVTQRSDSVRRQLRPQGGLYGVLVADPERARLDIVGAIRDVVFPAEETPTLLDSLAAPTTRVVTLTVSEKGYRRRPDGAPDLTDDGAAADVATLADELVRGGSDAVARTPVGMLTRGLARRWHRHSGPVNVVCCDNMVDNGATLRELVAGTVAAASVGNSRAAATAERFHEWLAREVAFPSTMVDRIAPATSDHHHRQAEELLGLRDEGLVVAEPFSQWVLTDAFTAARPAWELAGATLTTDVHPYEQAKLRLLNGAHSALAYLGALAGYASIAEAMADAELRQTIWAMMTEDVVPTLEPPDGTDLAGYGKSILERFENPVIRYLTTQVAMDGSQKVPVRLLGTVSDRLVAGVVPTYLARAVAAWMVFVQRGRSADGRKLPLNDPLADVLQEAAAGSEPGLADRMLALREVFPADVGEHPGFRDEVARHAAELLRLVPAG